MRLSKKLLSLTLVLGFLFHLTSAYALDISARGGFVLNADSYEELYSQNGDTPMVPASMTKLMAIYVVYDAMANGRVDKGTMIPIGAALSRFSRDPGYSNVPLRSGASYSLDSLLDAIFVVSANAAIMAVGDYLFGSEAAFVERMNAFASQWYLAARFQDCTGISSGNLATPRAMAAIANRLVTDFPDCLQYSSKTSIQFDGKTYYATNKMLPGRAYSYPGNMGLKTGTTSAAGACFTGVTQRDGVRLISVVMGAPYSNARYTDSIAMLDYAFAQAAARQEAAPEPAPTSAPEPEPAPQQDYVSISVPQPTPEPAPEAVTEPAPEPTPEPVSEPAPEPTPEPAQEPTPASRVSDWTVYVNNLPIESFVQGQNRSVQLIRVEDLREYGFTVTYDPDANTLTVVNDPEAPLYGHDLSGWIGAAPIWNTKAVNVLLKQNAMDLGIYAAAVYDAAGQAAIDVQELAYLGWVLQKDGRAAIATR